MKRIEALKIILNALSNELVITTTGMTSREAFGTKDREENFYMVGSMGLVTPLCIGVALNCRNKKVIGIEGDGSALMNLGSLAMAGAEKPPNLITVVLDNGTYESTGGQECISRNVDFSKIANSAGYVKAMMADDTNSLTARLKEILGAEGPNFLLVKIESSHEEGIPRVSFTPKEIKERFMKSLIS